MNRVSRVYWAKYKHKQSCAAKVRIKYYLIKFDKYFFINQRLRTYFDSSEIAYLRSITSIPGWSVVLNVNLVSGIVLLVTNLVMV